jgi:hypothetical protein
MKPEQIAQQLISALEQDKNVIINYPGRQSGRTLINNIVHEHYRSKRIKTKIQKERKGK